MLAADVYELAIVAPLAFVLGVVGGLFAASKYRIIRRPEPEPEARDHSNERG